MNINLNIFEFYIVHCFVLLLCLLRSQILIFILRLIWKHFLSIISVNAFYLCKEFWIRVWTEVHCIVRSPWKFTQIWTNLIWLDISLYKDNISEKPFVVYIVDGTENFQKQLDRAHVCTMHMHSNNLHNLFLKVSTNFLHGIIQKCRKYLKHRGYGTQRSWILRNPADELSTFMSTKNTKFTTNFQFNVWNCYSTHTFLFL